MANKTIGILGGTSPESTISYYQYLTREYFRRFGDFGFPEILIYSVRFQDVIDWGENAEWEFLARKIVSVFNILHKAGAELGLIAANTPHIVFDQVQHKTPLPLISIVDATAEAISAKKFTSVGLLGTKFTMAASFYPDTLQRYGITTIVPSPDEQKTVNRIIYEELAHGQIKIESKETYLKIINNLEERGAQGVILGCTEIPLLIQQTDSTLPLFDTTIIHARKTLDLATQD